MGDNRCAGGTRGKFFCIGSTVEHIKTRAPAGHRARGSSHPARGRGGGGGPWIVAVRGQLLETVGGRSAMRARGA